MGVLSHKALTNHTLTETGEWVNTDTHLVGGVASLNVVTTAETQTLTSKTLTSPVINGTVTTTGLTMPAHTSGVITFNNLNGIYRDASDS